MNAPFRPYEGKKARREKLKEKLERLKFVEERNLYEGSLYEFVKVAWSSIDSSEFQENWALEAFCDHLECVTRGDVTRLLGNYPPRCSKTTIASICWVAWTWAQSKISFTSGPQVRFLCGSYNETLALLNSNQCRRLILSPFYQKYWGNRFDLTKDQNTKSRFDNTKGGSRQSTSVGGSLLGLGGDVICFPRDELVLTEDGLKPIGDMVDGRLPVRVWSFDTKTGRAALKPLTGWHRNPASAIVKVHLSDGSSFRCTPDHKVWTRNGWVSAVMLSSDDVLPGFSTDDIADAHSIDAVSPAQRTLTVAGRADAANLCGCQFGLGVALANRAIRRSANAVHDRAPRHATSDLLDGADLDAVAFGQCGRSVTALRNLYGLGLGQDCSGAPFVQRKCSVTLGVFDILRPSAVLQVIESGIAALSVLVPNLFAKRARSDKFGHHDLMTKGVMRFSVAPQAHPWIALMWARLQNLLRLPVRNSSLQDCPFLAADSAEAGDAVAGKPGDRSPLFIEFVGHVDATYCLTVADYGTFVVGSGNIIVSNCIDDPHNTETEKVIETDADRKKVASWFKEVRSTRLNNPKLTAIVVVMQRLHEEDLSGIILESEDEDWTHLMIPMEFDSERRTPTIVLPQYDYDGEPEPWTDPRTQDGELMWPERFGHREVDRMKGIMGPYMSSGRLQQAPVPKGGGIIMRDWWQLWDQQEAQRYGLEWNHNLKEFPPFELVVGSIDTSYGEKQENDFNAMTVWGIWIDRNRNRRAMLMFGWAKRLKLNGKVIAQLPNEAKVNYMARQKEEWGLIEWVADTCKRYRVKRLLIEDKTRGRDVANEINRLYARDNWGVELLNPQKDKVSRTHGVVPLFTDNVVWAPNTKWAEAVIAQSASFPKGAHDDIHDTVTQFLNWARENGILVRADEMSAALEDEMRPKGHDQGVAEMYGVAG